MQTIQRLGKWLSWFGSIIKGAFIQFIGPFLEEVMPVIRENFTLTMNALNEFKVEILKYFELFSGQSIADIRDFAILGRELGHIFGVVLKFAAKSAVGTIKRLTSVLRFMNETGHMRALVSDILKLGKAFFALVTGSDRSLASLRTFGLALADVITSPFRLAMLKLLDLFIEHSQQILPIVARFNTKLANQLKTVRTDAERIKEALKEGYLATDMPAPVLKVCLLYTSPSPRDVEESRMPSSA